MFAKLRIQKGLTQQELADLVGVKRSTVAMWEKKKSFPRADKLIRLAKIYGCTVDDLLKD